MSSLMRYLAFLGLIAVIGFVWVTVFAILELYSPLDLAVARTATVMLSVAIVWRMVSGGWEP